MIVIQKFLWSWFTLIKRWHQGNETQESKEFTHTNRTEHASEKNKRTNDFFFKFL
jgi:hypothetical protein